MWPFVASRNKRSQDLVPPDPVWKELQEGGELGAEAAALPRDRLPCRIETAYAASESPAGEEHTASLPRTLIKQALAALLRDGAVILSGAASPSVCASVILDVSAEAEQAAVNHGSGGRVGVASLSVASHSILADHRVIALCNGILGAQVLQLSQTELEHLFTDARNPPQRDRRSLQMPWELHVAHAAAGSKAVAPHSNWHHGGHRGPQNIGVLDRLAGSMQLDAYWCLDCSSTVAALVEVRLSGTSMSAELNVGDVLLVRDNIWRRATVCTDGWLLRAGYQLAFLDAEENLLSQCPPNMARHFPPHMQRLVGYAQPYRNLSRFAAGVVNPPTAETASNVDQTDDVDPAQALAFVREADWATPDESDQPESTWAQAQSLMLDWEELTESRFDHRCEELLPPTHQPDTTSTMRTTKSSPFRSRRCRPRSPSFWRTSTRACSRGPPSSATRSPSNASISKGAHWFTCTSPASPSKTTANMELSPTANSTATRALTP